MFTTNSGRFISYYGREHTLDIQRQDGNNPTISTIDQLFNVLLNVWCKETAYPSCQKDYDYDNDPTYGQCAITASLVYDLFDGTIYKLKVDGGGTHYFNKINGHYIDLTSDQFDLYDIPLEYVPNEVVPREYCGMNADTKKKPAVYSRTTDFLYYSFYLLRCVSDKFSIFKHNLFYFLICLKSFVTNKAFKRFSIL